LATIAAVWRRPPSPRHHLQLWAEFYEARFEVRIGNADTFSYYLEAKYKITSQLFGAPGTGSSTAPSGRGSPFEMGERHLAHRRGARLLHRLPAK
jgi:hypothetical protein